MDPRGKFSDARRPQEDRWREVVARVDARMTGGARSKKDYFDELFEGGIPLMPAAKFAEAHFDAMFERTVDGTMTANDINEINAAAQRDRLGVSREVQVEVERRDPLGIREEVSDASDLETVLRAIEAQAKLLHRQSEDLKDVAERLRS